MTDPPVPSKNRISDFTFCQSAPVAIRTRFTWENLLERSRGQSGMAVLLLDALDGSPHEPCTLCGDHDDSSFSYAPHVGLVPDADLRWFPAFWVWGSARPLVLAKLQEVLNQSSGHGGYAVWRRSRPQLSEPPTLFGRPLGLSYSPRGMFDAMRYYSLLRARVEHVAAEGSTHEQPTQDHPA